MHGGPDINNVREGETVGISLTENRQLRLVVNGAYFVLEHEAPPFLYVWVDLTPRTSACTIDLRKLSSECLVPFLKSAWMMKKKKADWVNKVVAHQIESIVNVVASLIFFPGRVCFPFLQECHCSHCRGRHFWRWKMSYFSVQNISYGI